MFHGVLRARLFQQNRVGCRQFAWGDNKYEMDGHEGGTLADPAADLAWRLISWKQIARIAIRRGGSRNVARWQSFEA